MSSRSEEQSSTSSISSFSSLSLVILVHSMAHKSVHFKPALMQQHSSAVVHDLLHAQDSSSSISSGAGFVPIHLIQMFPSSLINQPCPSGDGILGEDEYANLQIRAW